MSRTPQKVKTLFPMDRSLPCNIEAEKRVLGACIRDEDAITATKTKVGLVADDFYQPGHATIFAILVEMFDRKIPIDLVTLSEMLESRGQLNSCGGAYYLIELANCVATSVNAEYHALIVREKAIRRNLIRANSEISQDAFENQDLALIALRIQELSRTIQQPLNRADPPQRLGDYFDQVIDHTQKAIERLHDKGILREIPSGIDALDRLSGGFERGMLVVIATRPSEGKTALATRILGYAAETIAPCLIFPLEMSVEEMAARYLYSSSNFPFNAEVRKEDIANLMRMANRLHSVEIYADPCPRLSIQEICRRAELFAAQHGSPAIVAIDYLTLISEPETQPGRRRFSEGNYRLYVQEITRECKLLARQLHTVVLLLAQFNREIEKGREWRKPRMSDIRESGSIEQDADMIILPYREDGIALHEAGRRWLLVAKNRNGPTGEAPVFFRPGSTRFEDVDWRNCESPSDYHDEESNLPF